MLNQQTIDKLHMLKLMGMAQAFTDQLNQPDMDRLSFAERFGLIVESQWTWKEDNRMSRYLKNAKLKQNACVEDIDFKTHRGLDQSVIMKLVSCDWIKRHQNVIISGPCLNEQSLPRRVSRSLHPRPEVCLSDGSGPRRRQLWKNNRSIIQSANPGD